MCFDDALDGFDAYLKANCGLSDVEECLVALRKQGCVDLNEVTIEDLRLWMAESSKNHARSSMARKTVAVRGFFAWAYDHDMTSANPATSLQTPKIRRSRCVTRPCWNCSMPPACVWRNWSDSTWPT